MKHHLRTDKTCLNCGDTIPNRYCSRCGQENIEPKEKTSHLVRHFFEDITHYDSKFFITIRRLLFSPGFLTKEHLAGKRARYLNPVRMYVFISSVFFLVLYLNKSDDKRKNDAGGDQAIQKKARRQVADSLYLAAQNRLKSGQARDSVEAEVLAKIASSLYYVDSLEGEEQALSLNIGSNGIFFTLKENKYSQVAEYDSIQKTLANDKKDKGWLRWLIRTNVRLKERYGSRSEVTVKENFDRSVPKLMFVLLPLFALFIKWFHSKKKYYYAQHVIFSIHFHSFIFLLLLMMILILLAVPAGFAESVVESSGLCLLFLYLVLALRKAYSQSIWLALVKAFSISIVYILVLIICLFLLAVFIFFSA